MTALLNKYLTVEPKLPLIELGSFKQFLQNYLLILLYFIAGSIAPFSFLSVYLWVTIEYVPELKYLLPEDDQLFQALLVLSSFIGGFGLAVFRIHLLLKASGKSLSKSLALNLNAYQGKLFPALKHAFLALVLGISLEALVRLLLPFSVDDSAANFILSLASNPWALTAVILLCVFGAGILEELVFRGFVFNSIRSRFRKAKTMERFFRNSEDLADYMAVGLSALIFAVVHMTPSAIPGIFVLGFVLGELYRRTGSLIPSMIAHAANNYIAILLLLYSIG